MNDDAQISSKVSHSITRKYALDSINQQSDPVCVEEPLSISINYQLEGREFFKVLAISMRTPGDEFEQAVGLLLSEGIINNQSAIYLGDKTSAEPVQVKSFSYDQQSVAAKNNALQIELTKPLDASDKQYERQLTSYSACGVCGKTSLKQIELLNPPTLKELEAVLTAETIQAVAGQLANAQQLFQATGGSHAAALFDLTGELVAIKEDIGRHNALDKLIGHCLLNNIDMSEAIVIVSGRASFELVQKAVMAGIPILMAVGAPSSLAISTAQRFNLTLIGFLRQQRYNLYQGQHRLAKS